MDTAVEQRNDEAIAEAIVSGRSLRAVRKEFGLSQAEIDSALERLWPVDTAARVRMIKRDVGRLDRLIEKFYEKALAGCIQSGLLTVRIYERLHGLVGLDAVQRIDLAITAPPEAPTRARSDLRSDYARSRAGASSAAGLTQEAGATQSREGA
jgi:hypothetical protein